MSERSQIDRTLDLIPEIAAGGKCKNCVLYDSQLPKKEGIKYKSCRAAGAVLWLGVVRRNSEEILRNGPGPAMGYVEDAVKVSIRRRLVLVSEPRERTRQVRSVATVVNNCPGMATIRGSRGAIGFCPASEISPQSDDCTVSVPGQEDYFVGKTYGTYCPLPELAGHYKNAGAVEKIAQDMHWGNAGAPVPKK